MPTVEKVAGPRIHVRDIGRFSTGDRADVSADEAQYLCEELGGFERVDDEDSTDTCEVMKSDGDVCGRDLPCPYHSDEEE
jgi:hypothetical protein